MDYNVAWRIVGGLSRPGKMPCFGYGLPAEACRTGSVLARIAGTICSRCYAKRLRYRWPSVRTAMARRLASLDDPRWVEAMAVLLRDQPYFRWHDSGDLQSVDHLHRLVQVCRATPHTLHWLPTRETAMMRAYTRSNPLPGNLVVRLSAARFDAPAPERAARELGVCVSGAGSQATCPAKRQGNACGPCRACWDPWQFSVTYAQH